MKDKKQEKKEEMKVPRIFNGSVLFRAKVDYDVLDFIFKQLPLREDRLISRVSVLYHHSTKWCRRKIADLLSMGLIEYEKEKPFSYLCLIYTTDIFEEYLKDLKRNIRKYEKIVEKERKEHEEWLREHSSGFIPNHETGDGTQ